MDEADLKKKWYDPEIDGPVDRYLRKLEDHFFRGYEPFKFLWENKYTVEGDILELIWTEWQVESFTIISADRVRSFSQKRDFNPKFLEDCDAVWEIRKQYVGRPAA